jgi:uncharacterized membrane protein YbhN (UPF0104 family)
MTPLPPDQQFPELDLPVIEEPPLPNSVRRPRDLLRLVVTIAIAAALLVITALAVTTTSGLEADLIGVVTGLPAALIYIVQFFGGLGLLIIPVAVSIDLVARRRNTQLLTALAAAAIAAFFAVGLRFAIEYLTPGQLLEALTKVKPDGMRTLTLDAALAAIVALLTVAQLAGRSRWQIFSAVIVGSVATTLVLSSSLTVVAVAESILLGFAIGLISRYAMGSPSERPDGMAIALALRDAGLPLTHLTRLDLESRGRRRYRGVATENGTTEHYRIHVLDRDQEGAGIAAYLWRQIRVIRPAARPAFLSLRRNFEHESMVTFAAQATQASVRKLVAVTEVGVFAAALAYVDPQARPLSELDPAIVTDQALDSIWATVDALHQSRVAHRGLAPSRIQLREDSTAVLTDFRDGEIAASDLALALDTAELLVSLASLVGAERSVQAGVRCVGAQRIASCTSLVQSLSMSDETRTLLKSNKGLLKQVQQVMSALSTEEVGEQPPLARFQRRTIISAVGLSVAAYLLISQIGTLDLGQILGQAELSYVAAALILSFMTYVGGTLSLIGFTPAKIRAIPALLAHFAATYYALFAPAVVSAVGVNTSFLQRSGVGAATAVASVGITQVSAVIASLLMVLIFGALAGASPQSVFSPSEGIVIAVGVVVFVVLIGVIIAPIRHYAIRRLRPIFTQGLPRLIDILQNPRALITGFGGNFVMNLAYIFTLVACVRAYGNDASIPALALVFLVGSAVASVVPTPGGLGAVEVALTASLTAAGVDAATAVSAVLLYRVVTFWIPVPIGWASSQWLSKRGLLPG